MTEQVFSSFANISSVEAFICPSFAQTSILYNVLFSPRLMDPSFKNDVTWIFNRLPPAKQVNPVEFVVCLAEAVVNSF